MQADWDDYGESAFEFRMLADMGREADEVMRRTFEQAYLDNARAAGLAYNRSPSAFSVAGTVWDSDQCAALSEALAGKPKSAAHRTALGASAKRRWDKTTPEERREYMAAMGRGNLGRPKSPAARLNMARAHSTLTEDQVREIKRRLAAGEAGRAIFRDYPVSEYMISNIKRGKSWTHVTV